MSYPGPFPFSVPTGGTGFTTAPAFNVYLSSTQGSATGDGTQFTVPFDTPSFDTTNSYDNVTFNYVCPVTGNYCFNTFIFSFNNVSGNNHGQLYFVNSTQATNYDVAELNPFAASYSGGGYGYNASLVISCVAGDNISVMLQVSGGAKGVQILGAPGVQTYFAGFLLR